MQYAKKALFFITLFFLKSRYDGVFYTSELYLTYKNYDMIILFLIFEESDFLSKCVIIE